MHGWNGLYKITGGNLSLSLSYQKSSFEKATQEQIKFEKWKCLLELALNKYSPLQKYYNLAIGIANDEYSIKNLITNAYPSTNEQPNYQTYYCLFYFLKWHFSEQNEKISIKNSFLQHYKLIADSGDENIKQRAEELKQRIGITD